MRDFFKKIFGDDKRGRRRRSSDDPRQQIQQKLESSAQTVSIRRLKKYGLQSVRVVDANTIQAIVNSAVDEALRHRGADLSGTEREEVLAYAKAHVLELMEENQKLTEAQLHLREAKGEAEQRLTSIAGEMDGLQQELQQRLAELEEERKKEVPPQVVTIDEESFAELDRRIGHLIERLMRHGELLELDADGAPTFESLAKELRACVARTVEGVRAVHLESGGGASGEKIDMLEKRIAKLNEALGEREKAIRKLAAAKGIEPGVASVYDAIQGLDDEDPDYERKHELLREVFVQNLELQGIEYTEEDLSGTPDPAPEPVAPPADPDDLPLPPGFTPPEEDLIGESSF